MSGYTPVFRSVFTGSLCGQWPDTAAWLSLLALADKNGEVDMTPQYISSVTGMPLGDLLLCISRFLDPDPMSRTRTNEGRRLELIDSSRDWGWRIINFKAYREKARLAAKSAREVEEGRNAERMSYRKTAADRREPPLTDPSYADSNSNLLKKATYVATEREEAIEMFRSKVAPAIRDPHLRKNFERGSQVWKAVQECGGWEKLGLRDFKKIGQTEQEWVNAYLQL